MTTTTAPATSADLLKAILDKGATVADLLKAFNEAQLSPLAEAETPIPRSPAVSAEVGVILRGLAATLKEIKLPMTRRELSVEEREELTQVFEELHTALAGLKVSEEQIKFAFQQHFDAHARAEGLIDPTTPRNKDGFAILPDKTSAAVPGLDKKVVRQVTIPTAVITEEGLANLEELGILSHREYLAATKPARDVREEGILDLIKSRPELLEHLAAVAVLPKAMSNTITLAPNK